MVMILVTGAGGQLGRLVAQELAGRTDPAKVVLGTRDPAKIADLAAKGFRTAAVDFDKPATLSSAFSGVDTLLIISADGPNGPRLEQHKRAIDAAKAAGVGRIAYTSVINPTHESLFDFAASHGDTEAYIRASGVSFTFLRNNLYVENIAGAIEHAKATGVLSLPGVNGRGASLTRADVAAAVAGALVGAGHANKAYEITGPEALSLSDLAPILSKAWGKPVTAQEMPEAAFTGMLQSFSLPPFLVEALVGIRKAMAHGEYEAVSQDAAKLAGRRIESFGAWAARQ
jgi:NAD(P)H dehydrogenase (quinone)